MDLADHLNQKGRLQKLFRKATMYHDIYKDEYDKFVKSGVHAKTKRRFVDGIREDIEAGLDEISHMSITDTLGLTQAINSIYNDISFEPFETHQQKIDKERIATEKATLENRIVRNKKLKKALLITSTIGTVLLSSYFGFNQATISYQNNNANAQAHLAEIQELSCSQKVREFKKLKETVDEKTLISKEIVKSVDNALTSAITCTIDMFVSDIKSQKEQSISQYKGFETLQQEYSFQGLIEKIKSPSLEKKLTRILSLTAKEKFQEVIQTNYALNDSIQSDDWNLMFTYLPKDSQPGISYQQSNSLKQDIETWTTNIQKESYARDLLKEIGIKFPSSKKRENELKSLSTAYTIIKANQTEYKMFTSDFLKDYHEVEQNLQVYARGIFDKNQQEFEKIQEIKNPNEKAERLAELKMYLESYKEQGLGRYLN